MHHATTTLDPGRSVFAETLGQAPSRGRLAGRGLIVVGAGQRQSPTDEDVPFGCQGTGWQVACACPYLISHEASCVNASALLVDGGLGVSVWRT